MKSMLDIWAGFVLIMGSSYLLLNSYCCGPLLGPLVAAALGWVIFLRGIFRLPPRGEGGGS